MSAAAPPGGGPRIWVDVEDLFDYLAHHSRPSGIQRVTFEICQALHRLDGGAGRVGFVRRAYGPRDVVTVEWSTLERAFRRVADAGPPPARPTCPKAGLTAAQLLLAASMAQAQALWALAKLPVLAVGALRERGRGEPGPPPGERLGNVAAPGDSFVVLGSPWSRRDYVQTVRWVRDDLRLRFALLIYDLIPLRRPEWCDAGVIITFTEWHRMVLPLADQIFAISQATAEDVTEWSRESPFTLAGPVRAVPMGTGLPPCAELERGAKLERGAELGAADAPSPGHLPAPGSYVLFVSTLEARKNHALLFRVWRRLLAELPRDQVPTLVFAGRVGWLVADLMQQLENTSWLDGKIRLLRDPSDAELMALYRGCRFTLFPSLFEGWGLPVSESLALGRPCIASNRTSLPEAGGTLARYFDPEDIEEATRVIRSVIEDPAGLAAWRERVAREFRHVPWEASAAVIRDTMAALDPVAACPV